MSEKRKYRTFTPEQKLEIVLADFAAIAPCGTSAGSTRSPRRSTTSGETGARAQPSGRVGVRRPLVIGEHCEPVVGGAAV